MRWIKFAILVIICTLLQAGIVSVFAVTDIKPNLLLILLVFFAIHSNTTEAIITSFSIGFAADLIGTAMGSHLISFGAVGTLLAYMLRYITVSKMPYQAMIIFLMNLFVGIMAAFLAFTKGQTVTSETYTVLLGASLYSSLIGPFLFLPCAWWMGIKNRKM